MPSLADHDGRTAPFSWTDGLCCVSRLGVYASLNVHFRKKLNLLKNHLVTTNSIDVISTNYYIALE